MAPGSNLSPIVFWDRAQRAEKVEQVYGERLVRQLYDTAPGRTLTHRLLSRPFLSRAYGVYQSSGFSKRKVEPFIREFQIPMDEFEPEDYASFNDFFVRRFRTGMRPFTQVPGEMPAFCEARYLAYESVAPNQTFPIKGANLSPERLLGSAEKAKPFKDGPAFVARLCPTDYHRFHFPDSGETLSQETLHGALHSVNPIALMQYNDIFLTNERQVSILKTEHFGLLAYVEVGALCVGRIVQSHPATGRFARGDEKGYFLFGGSTVILLGERGKWRPDADLLEQSRIPRETLVRLGERIATLC